MALGGAGCDPDESEGGGPAVVNDTQSSGNSSGAAGDGSYGSTSGGGSTAGELCAAVPERMLVFGDSLFACFGVEGGKEGEACSARMSHEYLEGTYASGVTYENYAVSGAVTSDVVESQIPEVPVGMPGHALVVIWVGGNDIVRLLPMPEDRAAEAFDELQVELDELWASMLAWVDDPANFPDGATLIINTQFNPFDDCTALPYLYMSPLKTSLLVDYNATLRGRAQGRERTYIAEQYPEFLGHGHHHATEDCPHFEPESEYWMLGGGDLIHPNDRGHSSIATTLNGAVDAAFACE